MILNVPLLSRYLGISVVSSDLFHDFYFFPPDVASNIQRDKDLHLKTQIKKRITFFKA